MPTDRKDAQDSRAVTTFRRQLIDATEGVAIDAQPFSLRISNVPLFRREGDGYLQAIRIRIGQQDSETTLTVRVRQDRVVLDQQDAEPARRPQSIYLLVPEVDSPTSVTLEVEAAGSIIATQAFDVTPQRKWTIHLVHHSHYDIGYTDPQSEVMSAQLSYIDAALELATITDDWPDDARFRWNIEVNWPLQQWLRTRPKHARDHLIERIEEGRIEVHALPFSMHTEAYSFDELAQQLAFTAEMREHYGIDIVSAMQTDVPGAAIGLSTLLTDADIKYLAVAHNYAGRSVPHLRDGQQLTRPFYWKAPDGERLLVWYTDTLHGMAYMEAMTLGFGTGYDDVVASLPEYLNALSQRSYPYGHGGDWIAGDLSGIELTKAPYPHDILHLRVQGAFADNASPSLIPSGIVRSWNDTWAFPRLRMSLDRDFFADAEARVGEELDTFEGDWTDWWADGIGSAAVPLGKNRESQSSIRTAQTINALADIVTDAPNPNLGAEVGHAYQEMALFDEHTWGAANPWEHGSAGMDSGEYQWTRKSAFAYTAEERVRTLLEGGLQRIAPLGATKNHGPDDQLLLVFNPSSWARTDLVRIFLPERSLEHQAFNLIDAATDDQIPFILEPQTNEKFRPRGQFIRFLARDIPPVGYARYRLAFSGNALSPPAPKLTGTSDGITQLSTDKLAVEIGLASATIASVIDRSSGRNLVASDSPFGFNAYIYDRYTSAPGFNHLSSRLGPAGPWLLGSRDTGQYGLVTARESNNVWEQVTIRYAGGGADWLETTVTLPHGVSRVHICNRLHKPVTMQKESVYFAFPFAAEHAELAFEITGGVVTQNSPRVPGSADHFRAIRHWATLDTPDSAPIAWATTDAALVQVGNIHIPYAPFPSTIREYDASEATIYSWALNNIWDTNFPPEQGGEMTFRYTIATGQKPDASQLGRDTGASAAQTLVGVAVPLNAEGAADAPDRASFIDADDSRIEVSHLAPSRHGSGIAVFLESHATESVDTWVRVGRLPFRSAQVGTFLETHLEQTEIQDNAVHVTIVPGELKAVVLQSLG